MSSTDGEISIAEYGSVNVRPTRFPGVSGIRRLLARVAAIAIIAFCMAMVFGLRWGNVTYYWYQPLSNLYSIAIAGFIFSRFVLSFCYRAPKDINISPTVSIIITAFNEEDAIYRTVECCYAADYAASLFDVIVVDDGSSDGTIKEIQRAQQRWPSLALIAFERNKGKREAMAAGALLAKGEILVYVDSDSFLRSDGLRKIVQGFADPRVAAVAGHTEVANVTKNSLTKMQQARYYVAFRVIKAAESVFGTVTCCPGCFSAYRRSCMMEVLEPWLGQHFLGVQATFGDDRSLTNYLLRKYRVIYSADAIATTIVPEGHKQFLKQQLRWKKSWFRETLIAATFMWKKPPLAALAFYGQLLFPIIAPLLIVRICLWLPIANGDFVSPVVYLLGTVLIGLMFSAYYLFWNSDRYWIYGLYFTLYYLIFLVWQMPYAIATQRDNRWGTR
ncbi:glycosyltransferase family 2 protein [Methylovulum psychrotolerans]|uniref:N-acetylglucosaminyltransferase n=1 Tax=Methylovulum psychrotolerans TaxID=1704499 RepID=A0A2S5CGJ5_9GAMM|nr:glycosyltransferase [Methylovulum psychrotolerans]POZ49862.1 glycosyltransferase [Methylovulum psychrotolerans]